MYGWGPDDVNTWKKPGGYKYDDAKAPYLETLAKEASVKGSRVYSKKAAPVSKAVLAKNKELTTDSKNPLVLLVDGTGSMQKWPAEIFDRIPLLYQTLSQYKDDVELSINVVGDANSDQWPLQVTEFAKGVTLDDKLKAVHAEGGGGPGIRESYELFAYFADQKIKTPNAVSPFLIVMGDEKFYEKINPAQIKVYIGDTVQAELSSVDVWKNLAQKYDIYFLQKQYPGRHEEIKQQWADAIGEQKIIPVYDAQRIVDIAMGLVAKKWGHFSDFGKNLSARQDELGIATVMESLRAAPDVDYKDMKSVVGKSLKGAKSMKLIE